jgi:hypothetical protein
MHLTPIVDLNEIAYFFAFSIQAIVDKMLFHRTIGAIVWNRVGLNDEIRKYASDKYSSFSLETDIKERLINMTAEIVGEYTASLAAASTDALKNIF